MKWSLVFLLTVAVLFTGSPRSFAGMRCKAGARGPCSWTCKGKSLRIVCKSSVVKRRCYLAKKGFLSLARCGSFVPLSLLGNTDALGEITVVARRHSSRTDAKLVFLYRKRRSLRAQLSRLLQQERKLGKKFNAQRKRLQSKRARVKKEIAALLR